MDYMDISSIRFFKSYDDFIDAKGNKRVILATTKAKNIYTNFKYKKSDTLLFGRESSGVPEALHKSIEHKIKIPMIKNKRSLNLATSAAIIISEIPRVAIARQSERKPRVIFPIIKATPAAKSPPTAQEKIIGNPKPPKKPLIAGLTASIA